jgi:hypothetical protein
MEIHVGGWNTAVIVQTANHKTIQEDKFIAVYDAHQ